MVNVRPAKMRVETTLTCSKTKIYHVLVAKTVLHSISIFRNLTEYCSILLTSWV